MAFGDNIALFAGLAIAGIAVAIVLAIVWQRRRNAPATELVDEADLFAPGWSESLDNGPLADPAAPQAANENAGQTSPRGSGGPVAISLVPAQLRVKGDPQSAKAEVEYRLSLDNCGDEPLISLRAHLDVATVTGETDPERVGARIATSVAQDSPVRVAQLDPGDLHRLSGTLAVDFSVPSAKAVGSDVPVATPVVAVIRLRILAANLEPQTSIWLIGKARHQPGARTAAIVPVDLARGPAVHELLMARRIV